MTTTRLFVAGSTAAALALTLSLASVNARAMQTKNASEGIYTAAQASRGQTLYEKSCASCHELSKFKGPEFTKAWVDRPLTELHTALTGMPMDAPGTLKPIEYGDLIAYFLSMNGYPAGQAELDGTEATIKAIKLDARK